MSPRDVAVVQLRQYVAHMRWRQANGAPDAELAAMAQAATTIADRIQAGLYSDSRGFRSLTEILEVVSDEILYNARVGKATG